jgi:hypothetical protein
MISIEKPVRNGIQNGQAYSEENNYTKERQHPKIAGISRRLAARLSPLWSSHSQSYRAA